MRGKFITFEGIDGAGKSTHIESVRAFLAARGKSVVMTREPGGTDLGEAIRGLFLGRTMSPASEALLVFAARREHLERVVWPALERGDWVLCDRFTDATWAYQGGGHGVDSARIAELERWVHGGVHPDLTILFDLPPAVSRGRLERAAANGRKLDKFERESDDFARRVRAAYLERARAEPARFRIVDSTRPVETVRDELARIVDAL